MLAPAGQIGHKETKDSFGKLAAKLEGRPGRRNGWVADHVFDSCEPPRGPLHGADRGRNDLSHDQRMLEKFPAEGPTACAHLPTRTQAVRNKKRRMANETVRTKLARYRGGDRGRNGCRRKFRQFVSDLWREFYEKSLLVDRRLAVAESSSRRSWRRWSARTSATGRREN